MHPFTVAAYELGFGKQLDAEYNNVFIQKRDEKEVIVSYFNQQAECFKQVTSELTEHSSFKSYHLHDLIKGGERLPKRMSYVRFDGRPFYPRMNVDSNKNMFFEIVSKNKDRVVNSFSIHDLTIEGHRNELDNLCESSDIYHKKEMADWKFQNF